MARSKSTQSKVRVNLDLTRSAFEELESVKERLQSDSKAGLVRLAIKVLRWAVNAQASGNKIFVGPDRETAQEVQFFF